MKSEFLIPILSIIALAAVFNAWRMRRLIKHEFTQFVNAVRFHDFSLHYDAKKALGAKRTILEGFNTVNTTFRNLAHEKETQFQYLKMVLELVDTGILAYDDENGTVLWMNESLKQLLQLPYLKSIHSLEKREPALYQEVSRLSPGEKLITTLKREKPGVKVVLSATSFITGNSRYKLIAFQNVNEALEETESKAWQKLLSVMTHEIMNSVAPISSLANTLQDRLKELPADGSGITGDIELGIETIRKRSEGLLKFTEIYRNLYKITEGRFVKVRVSELFGNIHRLMQPHLEQRNTGIEIIMKEPLLTVTIDQGLIEQVLINLILNAIDAVKNKPDPRIVLSAYTDNDGHPMIKVADNGCGISDEILDKIFIPFFSTKRNGNGIGLPLSKQIMQVHKGSISVQTSENEGTAFYLRF
ncbi:MAG TPA: HAMP domain-containing sensor histidine kinase [Lentimicrobium sp.]|nr:HAMP domain-containing sensor histidine kinase [Lentimicrobium sp.]